MRPCSAIIGAFLLTLLPSAAFAESGTEQHACMSDAFRLCSDAIPDRHGVFLCLMNNKVRLTDSCRQVMERHSPRRHRYSGHARAEADQGEQ